MSVIYLDFQKHLSGLGNKTYQKNSLAYGRKTWDVLEVRA